METETKPKTKRTRTPKPTPPADAFNWGKREFGIIAKSFEGEPKEVRDVLITISAQLQLIKLNLSEPPLVISYLIRKAYPGVGDDQINSMLCVGILTLKLNIPTIETTLDNTIQSISFHTAGMTDNQWSAFWDGMFKAIAAPLMQWERVCIYAPYVYNVLVKPTVK